MYCFGVEKHDIKGILTKKVMLIQVLKDQEEQSGVGWGKGNTFQGKRAGYARAHQCERPSNLGNCKQHNTCRGQDKNGRQE